MSGESKNLCAGCVSDEILAQVIVAQGFIGRCHYCGNARSVNTIEALAIRIGEAFLDHFERTPDSPPENQIWELFQGFDRAGDPADLLIQEATGIDEKATADILEILRHQHADPRSDEESDFSEGALYARIPATGDRWQREWFEFVEDIKGETRFFNPRAMKLLRSVFADIDVIRTSDGRPLVVDAGPGSGTVDIFRARVFQSPEALEEALKHPDVQLGSPPRGVARAGRMNAAGISVFYGADTEEAALAEVRPPVGSNVAIARFTITRPLRLLDLTALDSVVIKGSIFDPAYADQVERAAFLKTLARRLSAPVLPDEETLDYIPTQAIADYLAGESSPTIDGLIFPSVQSSQPGRNVVLFRKAARVEEMELPPGSEVGITLYAYEPGDELDFDYYVREGAPHGPHGPPNRQNDAEHRDATWFPPWAPDLSDRREVTLRVDPESLRVHRVTGVDIRAQSQSVVRIRER